MASPLLMGTLAHLATIDYLALPETIAESFCQLTTQHVFPLLSQYYNLHLPGLKALSAFGLCSSALARFSLEHFIQAETPIARAGVLANIGPDGVRAASAAPGVVIASPSTYDPDYVYTWTRDSALVFKMLVDQFVEGEDDSLNYLIDDFVSAQSSLQYIDNPSGGISTGGLGEPKFHVNLTAFEDSWGRPQRDGPALRAITLIQYAKWQLERGNTTYFTDNLYHTIKLDLDYVANEWNRSTFDLWEEVEGSSYFTTMVQHRALREGAALFATIEQQETGKAYAKQAENLLCFAQSYWNHDGSYMTANTEGGRSGIDANTVLASNHNFDHDAGCDSLTFQPCSDRALSNLKVYVDSFRSEYSINAGIEPTRAVATGRYKEDVYYGGNPWYLTTTAVAEQLYYALYMWNLHGYLDVTNTSLAFFRQFDPEIVPWTYPSSSETYVELTTSIRNFADEFLSVAAEYTPSNGSLAEQFGRDDGLPLSAKDLTWSYAAMLTAFNAKIGKIPPSSRWGAKGLKLGNCASHEKQTVGVTFNVNAETIFGEHVLITGSVRELGNWKPLEALPLSPERYPVWSGTVKLPAGTTIEYKYIRRHDSEKDAVHWQSDPNNVLSIPNGSDGKMPGEGANIIVDDQWK